MHSYVSQRGNLQIVDILFAGPPRIEGDLDIIPYWSSFQPSH